MQIFPSFLKTFYLAVFREIISVWHEAVGIFKLCSHCCVRYLLLQKNFHKCLISEHVNNQFLYQDIHQAWGLMDSLVSLSLEMMCATRSCFCELELLCWASLFWKTVCWLPLMSTKMIFFCKLQTGLLNWECPCIDVGESSINGCTVCKKQEKADGCSVNGASSLDLTGRETFSLSEFLKAHWFFILAGFICFWITAVLLSLDIEPFTGLHIPLVFWYLLF